MEFKLEHVGRRTRWMVAVFFSLSFGLLILLNLVYVVSPADTFVLYLIGAFFILFTMLGALVLGLYLSHKSKRPL